ncbi:MAG: hypothetical protein WAX69_24530 [Victivallales bacterium]
MSKYSHTPEHGLKIETVVRFSHIYVIQSLGQAEFHSGRQLYDKVLKKQAESLGWLNVVYREIDTATQLFDLLEEIAENAKNKKEMPLLHFETHGSKEGLTLTEEYVSYIKLLPDLRKINVLTCNNLFIIVAACQGAYLRDILIPSLGEESPFWGVCGPSDELNGQILLEGYSAFYEECFKTENILAGFNRLQEIGESHGKDFNVWNSEYLFLLAFRKYLQNHCNEEQIEESVKRLRAMAKAQYGNYIDTPERSEMVRKRLGSADGQKVSFENMKSKFFMHEQCPANKNNFNPSFDDMMKMKI